MDDLVSLQKAIMDGVRVGSETPLMRLPAEVTGEMPMPVEFRDPLNRGAVTYTPGEVGGLGAEANLARLVGAIGKTGVDDLSVGYDNQRGVYGRAGVPIGDGYLYGGKTSGNPTMGIPAVANAGYQHNSGMGVNYDDMNGILLSMARQFNRANQKTPGKTTVDSYNITYDPKKGGVSFNVNGSF